MLWFLFSETVSAFWLSGLYGRNWTFLWTQPLSPLSTAGMIIFFFGIVWFSLLYGFRVWSKTHSWIICVFAVGLVCPRWGQIFWSTSTLGTFLAWASEAGAYLSLGLFLWLGVLDALQQIGLAMMLLQTLTRVHVAGTLLLIQVFGSGAYMLSKVAWFKPSDIFPNVGLWDLSDGWMVWVFWMVLACQIVCAYGYLFWFRKEQLARP